MATVQDMSLEDLKKLSSLKSQYATTQQQAATGDKAAAQQLTAINSQANALRSTYGMAASATGYLTLDEVNALIAQKESALKPVVAPTTTTTPTLGVDGLVGIQNQYQPAPDTTVQNQTVQRPSFDFTALINQGSDAEKAALTELINSKITSTVSTLEAQRQGISSQANQARLQAERDANKRKDIVAEFLAAKGNVEGQNRGAAVQFGQDIAQETARITEEESVAQNYISAQIAAAKITGESEKAAALAQAESDRLNRVLSAKQFEVQSEMELAQLLGDYKGQKTLAAVQQEFDQKMQNRIQAVNEKSADIENKLKQYQLEEGQSTLPLRIKEYQARIKQIEQDMAEDKLNNEVSRKQALAQISAIEADIQKTLQEVDSTGGYTTDELQLYFQQALEVGKDNANAYLQANKEILQRMGVYDSFVRYLQQLYPN